MSQQSLSLPPEVVELRPRPVGASSSTLKETLFWVISVAVMLAIGILKGINLVIILGYVLLGLWGINFLLARRTIRGVSARRLPTPPLLAGVPAEWVIDVRDDTGGKGAWSLEERVGDATARWLVVRSERGTDFRPRVRATFPKRGKYTIEPLVASSTFPFGLVRKSRRLLPADQVLVYPRPARVDGERLRAWLFRVWAGHEDERRKLRRLVDREAEVHGLRDYRAGDSPRRVHWKATARRGRLIVREYEDAAPPRLVLVVESWRPERPSAEDNKRLEAVISLAAGICREWRRQTGARLAMVLAGPTPLSLDGPAGAALTERQLVALALEPGGSPRDISSALGEISRSARAAPVLLISSRSASPLVETTGRSLGRGVAFANVERPEGWFQLPG